MVYFGKVKQGRIETDAGAALPEGTIVRIEPVNGAPLEPSPPAKDALDRLDDFAVDDDLPPDLAKEHDHYLYGRPKRGS